MRNVHMMRMSHFRGAIFMMQMSHVMVQMQRLSMMVPAHVFTRDANVSLQRCNFHDADVPCDGANATFMHDGASARIFS